MSKEGKSVWDIFVQWLVRKIFAKQIAILDGQIEYHRNRTVEADLIRKEEIEKLGELIGHLTNLKAYIEQEDCGLIQLAVSTTISPEELSRMVQKFDCDSFEMFTEGLSIRMNQLLKERFANRDFYMYEKRSPYDRNVCGY